jgi:riboflavin biosynthesis pyrimidine reductase
MKKVKVEMQVSIDGFAAHRDGRSNWMRWSWGEEWTWDDALYGGPTFASSLLNAGLIDESHLFVNPTVLGSGRSMFKDLRNNTNLKLRGATPFDCGVVVLQYVRGG